MGRPVHGRRLWLPLVAAVLISPASFRNADWELHEFRVALTREKVKDSPTIDAHQPVSRQHEMDFNRYYGYPHYWTYSNLWGTGSFPSMLVAGMIPRETSSVESEENGGDVHLRSVREISAGYHVQGKDEAIGHVHDFIVDDESWEVRYLVIDTSNWWVGRKVLIAPHWATHVSWTERRVDINLTRRVIQNSPVWDSRQGVNREYETQLYDYYGRRVYWESQPRPNSASGAGANPRPQSTTSDRSEALESSSVPLLHLWRVQCCLRSHSRLASWPSSQPELLVT